MNREQRRRAGREAPRRDRAHVDGRVGFDPREQIAAEADEVVRELARTRGVPVEGLLCYVLPRGHRLVGTLEGLRTTPSGALVGAIPLDQGLADLVRGGLVVAAFDLAAMAGVPGVCLFVAFDHEHREPMFIQTVRADRGTVGVSFPAPGGAA